MICDFELRNKILMFIWRWKLISTAALCAKFFRNQKAHAAYQKLNRLERNGFIRTVRSSIDHEQTWSLTNKGFSIVKGLLPELKESGFKSEKIDHDQIVTAVHIGDLLLTNAPHLQLFTEQELRRYEVEFYPEWVPKSKIHRPDGYWMSDGTSQSKLIALEVELSSKRDADYASVGMFYARRMEIRDVIWVVHNAKFASRIAKLICEAVSDKRMRHSFFLVSDIKEFGWGAKVRVGPILGCSLRAILNEKVNNQQLETIEKPSRNEQDQYSHELLFDFRKSRTKFADYRFS